jgi:hypothetical protein
LSSLDSIHDGSIAARPFEHQSGRISSAPDGRVSSAPEHHHGRVHGHHHHHSEQINGEPETSQENAVVAELSNLVASLSSLSAQAQSLPLSQPTSPQTPPGQTYRPQLTDYSLGGDAE